MEDDYNVLYGMKQKHGNNMKGTSNINEYYNNNNNELKHNRNKNTFYDYHLRPVSAKVVRELLSRNDKCITRLTEAKKPRGPGHASCN